MRKIKNYIVNFFKLNPFKLLPEEILAASIQDIPDNLRQKNTTHMTSNFQP